MRFGLLYHASEPPSLPVGVVDYEPDLVRPRQFPMHVSDMSAQRRHADVGLGHRDLVKPPLAVVLLQLLTGGKRPTSEIASTLRHTQAACTPAGLSGSASRTRDKVTPESSVVLLGLTA